jgi:hypothetical protein
MRAAIVTELEINTVAQAIFREFCRTIRRRLRERGDDQAWRRRWNQAKPQVRDDFKAEARAQRGGSRKKSHQEVGRGQLPRAFTPKGDQVLGAVGEKFPLLGENYPLGLEYRPETAAPPSSGARVTKPSYRGWLIPWEERVLCVCLVQHVCCPVRL